MTPKELIEFFEVETNKRGKLFVPDSPREEMVAKSLLSYTGRYSTERILLESIKLFIESRTEAVLVFDYALEARAFRDRIEVTIASEDKFKKVLEETRKRQEELEKRESSN